MKSLWQITRLLLLTSGFCLWQAAVADQAGMPPDARDNEVLKAFLQQLRGDKEFNLTGVSALDSTIVLHARTPTNSAFVQKPQTKSDAGEHTLPEGALGDLVGRNAKAGSKPEDHAATAASFAHLDFGPGIVVADLTAVYKEETFRAFKQAHPKARGFVNAYLPGYSSTGKYAIVRAEIGPWPHGAMVTALLEKIGDKWTVKWHRLTFYA